MGGRRRTRRKGGTRKDSERRQLARVSRHAASAPPEPGDRAPALRQLAIAALGSETPSAIEHAQLVREVREAAHAFSAVRWRWHPRDANEAADALVRELLWP